MIPALIYSKQRAAQLDLLLRSIRRFAPWVEPTILYTCTNGHEASYQRLIGEHDAWWTREGNFEADTRAFLLGAGAAFMWLVDDAVFFRPADEPTKFPWACRTWGSYLWRDHDPQSEQGWALVVGGTVYETDTIVPLLDFSFDNPNILERGLHDRRDRFAPEVIHGAAQSLCTIEHNAVSAASWNPTMNGDVDELRDTYLSGQRIDLDALGLAGTTAPHVQVPLVWRDERG